MKRQRTPWLWPIVTCLSLLGLPKQTAEGFQLEHVTTAASPSRRLTGSGAFALQNTATAAKIARLCATPTSSDPLMGELNAMRVREIKAELAALGISTASVFEKEELVKILFRARQPQPQSEGESDLMLSALLSEVSAMRVGEIKTELIALGISTADAFEKVELVKRLVDVRQKQQAGSNGKSRPVPPDAIRGPLFFTALQTGSIKAFNQASLEINTAGQPFPTVRIDVPSPSGPDFTLTLLLDTACSGLVLRPTIVHKYKLPTYSSPVTMTGAGGTSQANGLTQLPRFNFGGKSFGPLPAALQDISGLPAPLDGIIGLSWLSQFACVEIDFRNGELTLHKSETRLPVPPHDLEVVAEAEMSLTRLGIWCTDVTLDGRGPVKMLVDTGASSSFLLWEGVNDLGLSRSSTLVAPLRERFGAMGSDNVVMELTHRLSVERNLSLGRRSSLPGLRIGAARKMDLDIGNIAVLELLRQQGDQVNGILGIDAFSLCSTVRMTFNGPVPKLTLMQEK